MKQIVFKTGNSLAVTIPVSFVNMVGVKAGDKVKSLTHPEKGKITYIFPQSLQLPLSTDIVKSLKSKA